MKLQLMAIIETLSPLINMHNRNSRCKYDVFVDEQLNGIEETIAPSRTEVGNPI